MKTIDEQELPGMLRKQVHLATAPKGCVWQLVSYDLSTGRAVLITPKTRKTREALISDLRHIRSRSV